MKITFIFTDEYDLAQVPTGGRFSSNFEVPDAAKSFSDIQRQIVALSEVIGKLTKASLHVTCSDVGLKNYPINEGILPTSNNMRLWHHFQVARLYFIERTKGIRRNLTVYAPIAANFPLYPSGYYNLTHSDKWQDPTMVAFGKYIQALSQQLLILLNTDGDWFFESFHPFLYQNGIGLKLKHLSRKSEVEHRKHEREEEKRKAREAKRAEKLAANPPQELTHGAGRVVGARPGIYKGIQMRSQLEIRFAAELDERGIQWVYEGEALGAESYLVDFYLPDLSAWVEVKGRFEARDRQVLPEIAKYLKTERKHRLLVYTGSGKCHVVNPSGFREVERKNFWGELMR